MISNKKGLGDVDDAKIIVDKLQSEIDVIDRNIGLIQSHQVM